MGKLFGTDGIRGLANQSPITPEFAQRLGRAVVRYCGKRRTPPKIIIGRDTRLSGEMLEQALVSGILSAGGEAYALGEIPTPGAAYLTREMGGGAGIVVSASHNSYEYNGFKVFSGTGFKLSEREEGEIEDRIHNDPAPHVSSDTGPLKILENTKQRYLTFLKRTLPDEFTLKNQGIVLDCANGAASQIAPVLFKGLGARVETLFASPNGKNINQNCGSQHPETLKKKVLELGASVGLAFDGDGDRLVAVDEKGNILTGDQLLAICAKMLKERGELKKDLVVSTVMSNMGLRFVLKGLGIEQVTTNVGDRHVTEAMKARNANLGGEESGHIIFLDHHTTGDGLLSALQVLKAMKTFDKPLSELAAIMTVFPQTLINVPIKTKPDLCSVPTLVEEIEMVESRLGERGRVLVRYSGTEPVCRVMIEGDRKEDIERYAHRIAGVIRKRLN